MSAVQLSTASYIHDMSSRTNKLTAEKKSRCVSNRQESYQASSWLQRHPRCWPRLDGIDCRSEEYYPSWDIRWVWRWWEGLRSEGMIHRYSMLGILRLLNSCWSLELVAEFEIWEISRVDLANYMVLVSSSIFTDNSGRGDMGAALRIRWRLHRRRRLHIVYFDQGTSTCYNSTHVSLILSG